MCLFALYVIFSFNYSLCVNLNKQKYICAEYCTLGYEKMYGCRHLCFFGDTYYYGLPTSQPVNLTSWMSLQCKDP